MEVSPASGRGTLKNLLRIPLRIVGFAEYLDSESLETIPLLIPLWSATVKIQFQCTECDQQLAVSRDLSGRKVRCPACKIVQEVPSEEAPTSRAVAEGILKEPSPPSRPSRASVPSQSAADDFDAGDEYQNEHQDDFEERPRRRRRRQPQSSGPWKVIAVVVVLLALIGGGVAFLLMSGTEIQEDLKLVPADADMFFTMKVAELWDSHWAKQLKDMIPAQMFGQKDPISELEEKIGIKIAQLERVTAVFDIPNQLGAEPTPYLFVVKTSANYDKAAIMKLLKDAQKKTHQGKEYHVGSDMTIQFVNEKLLVVGEERGVRKSIEQVGKSGLLDSIKEVASSDEYNLVIGMNAEKAMRFSQMAGNNPFLGGGIPGAGMASAKMVKNIGFQINIEEDVTLGMQLDFRQSSDAKKFEGEARSLKAQIAGFKAMFAMNAAGMGAQESAVVNKVFDALEDLDIDRSGTAVSVEVEFDKATVQLLVNLLKKNLGNLMNPGAGNGNKNPIPGRGIPGGP